MKKTIVLMYHNIGIPPKEIKFPGLYVTPRMFRFQMWCLKAFAFKVVPLKELLSYVKGDIVHENLAAITFDDGYQDFYDNAYPVLKEYGYPSTVFLVSDLVGKENLWDEPKARGLKRLMDWETIFRLKEEGIVFGSHTKTHPFLSKLHPNDIVHEIKNSKDLLESRLQRPVEFFCYPYGDYSDEVINVVRESGYMGALTMKRGLVHRGDNPFEIRRSRMRYTTNPFLFTLRLCTNYEDRRSRTR
jgi:peptidoglycan/xylan/chitin deacetylase (PgdA/CDA1 family)